MCKRQTMTRLTPHHPHIQSLPTKRRDKIRPEGISQAAHEHTLRQAVKEITYTQCSSGGYGEDNQMRYDGRPSIDLPATLPLNGSHILATRCVAVAAVSPVKLWYTVTDEVDLSRSLGGVIYLRTFGTFLSILVIEAFQGY
ncbi:hypothetical protein E2C01_058904 [Portunus trituberculatus]|uniref:Uncharacterized protein n=1 Tax=Portunus trituberculatus TaxID=210409 RepID=A0A5B7H7M3_PORTR|nr:hypothetical protein [Portunus trituberculatus]